MARSFLSRIGNYAVGFVMGIAGGYMAKEVGSMVAQRLNLGDIGDWGATGLGLVALFLAGRFVVGALVRVVWPFYLGLGVGVLMATGLLDKIKEMLGMAKTETQTSEQSTSTNTTGG